MKLNEFLGLLYGDGCLKGRVSFSNSNPELVSKIHATMRKISNREIKVYISTYWPNEVIDDKALVTFWKKLLPGAKRFYKIRRRKRTTKNLRNKRGPKQEGTIELTIHDAQLGKELLSLVNKAKEQSDKSEAIEFLRGVIAAEGSVKLVNGRLRELRVAAKDLKEQEILRNLLRKVGIRPSKASYKFYIAISGIKNFKAIKKYGLFSLHPEKHNKFVKGFQKLIVKQPLQGE